MSDLIDTIPQSLKSETIAALARIYCPSPDELKCEDAFQIYDEMIRDEVEDYINRRDGMVSEIDVLMEEERAKQRIGDEFPQAKALLEKFRDMTLLKRRGEYDVKRAFMAQSGTAAQFDALRDALGGNPRPWWAPKPA